MAAAFGDGLYLALRVGQASAAETPRPKVNESPRQRTRYSPGLLAGISPWRIMSRFKETSVLTFAVGNADQIEARFAAKLATVVANNSTTLRIKVVNYPDNDKALGAFDHRQADLAILRTDAKVPPRARAVAVLENDLLLMLSPKKNKITSLASLKGKKIHQFVGFRAPEEYVKEMKQALTKAK